MQKIGIPGGIRARRLKTMGRQRALRLLPVGFALLLAATSTAAAPTGLERDVVFASHAPLARNAELLRRLQTPLTALRVEQHVPRGADTLAAWPLAPAQQRFAMYVPTSPEPAAGYALLVFVPPWNDARVPVQWIPVLDRTRTIFVSAADSGNDADVLNRREPLALLAAHGVMERYHVDPARVYVGGFSGGSRVALRLALGYPDLFRGALLDAGSDPIGTVQIPLPPADLLHRFQQSSRLVFLTGDDDAIRQAQQARSEAALQQWCVFNPRSISLQHTGHALADATAFAQGLDALSRPAAPDASKLAACRAHNVATLDAALAKVEALLRAQRFAQARQALTAIDGRYAGLAAARSVPLWNAMAAAFNDPR